MILAIEEGCLINIIEYPNQNRYAGQKIYVIHK